MNPNIHSGCIVIVIALTLVTTSPKLIRADGDDVFDTQQTANLPVPSRFERGDIINNKTLDSLFGEDRGPKQDKDNKNREGSQHTAGLSTESGQDIHNSQPDQPASVWITRSTPSRRGAAVRLTDTGRRLLRGGEYEKAVSNFERALSLEANPYIYFYLARAHYQLGHYQDSLNFLEVAESWLMQQPDWAPELVALKRQIPGAGVTLKSSVGLVYGQ